jgi:hypothetical protein
VEAARDILDGRRDHSVGSLIRSVTPVLGSLVVAGILAGIGIAIGFVLLIVPGLFLITIWAVIAPVIVIERKGALEAFGRSWELVKGNAWRVFGVVVVLFVIQILLGTVIQVIAESIADSFVGYAVADLLVSVLVTPLTALAAACVFFDLKARRGEPVLGTGEGGQVTPGGPVPTPGEAAAEPPPPPDAPAPPPPPPGPEAPR